MAKRLPERNRKYDDPKIQKIILDALEDGNYLHVAARLAGIHPDTLHEWISRGRAETGPPVLIEFVERIDLALAKWEADTVKVVHVTAQSGRPNTWQAAMTMLERKSPDRWGRRDRLGVQIDADKPLVQVQQLILSDPEVREASREFLNRVTSLDPAQTTPKEEEGD